MPSNVSNAPAVVGEYEFWNAFPEGAIIAAGDVYIIAHPSADPTILAEADHTLSFLSNGDDGFILVQGDETSFEQIDAVGDWNGDPGSGWTVAGVSNGTQNHTIVRKSSVLLETEVTGDQRWHQCRRQRVDCASKQRLDQPGNPHL